MIGFLRYSVIFALLIRAPVEAAPVTLTTTTTANVNNE